MLSLSRLAVTASGGAALTIRPRRAGAALTHRPTFGRAAEYGPPGGVNPE